MRFYQMDADFLAKQLKSNTETGRTVFGEDHMPGKRKKLISLFSQASAFIRSNFCLTAVIPVISFAIALIFSFLNNQWFLLNLTIVFVVTIALLYLLEAIILSVFKIQHLDRISANQTRAVVIRNGERYEILPQELEVGDLLCLETGSVVYCDARVINCENLYAFETSVFGLSIPSAKFSESQQQDNLPPEMQKNMLWKGSYIHSGNCMCIVTAVNDDCYVEKIGGLKKKRHHSLFFNRYRHIGQWASYIFAALTSALLLTAALITGRYVETFLVIGVFGSFFIFNPITRLMAWTYYRTAKKFYDTGVLIRSFEAYDRMNREKDLFFDANRLVYDHLLFSNSIAIQSTEEIGLTYLLLCVNNDSIYNAIQAPMKRCGIKIESLNQMQVGSRRSQDHFGNYCGIFPNLSQPMVIAVGYWKNMLPLVEPLDNALIEHIATFEKQGKMVWLVAGCAAGDALSFSEINEKLSTFTLVVFSIQPDSKERAVVYQLRRSSVRVHLFHHFSDLLGESIAAAYDMDDAVLKLPETRSFAVDESSMPIEKEQATIVFGDASAFENVIFQTKCMFCGLKRSLNFLGVIGLGSILTVFVLLLKNLSVEKIIFPLLSMGILLLVPLYCFVETARNCKQYMKSVLIGAFCGSTGFLSALLGLDMTLFSTQLTMLLLSLYLILRVRDGGAISKKIWVFLSIALIIAVTPWLFWGGNWLAAILIALFTPLATFLLDQFY